MKLNPITGLAAVGSVLANMTSSQWYAAGRHGLTVVGTLVVTVGLLSGGDWDTIQAIIGQLVAGVTQVGSGFEKIAEALGAAAMLFSTLKAGSTASPTSQATSLVKADIISPTAIKDADVKAAVESK
jgi:hypothetical protein